VPVILVFFVTSIVTNKIIFFEESGGCTSRVPGVVAGGIKDT
jgi:hypothetical protein